MDQDDSAIGANPVVWAPSLAPPATRDMCTDCGLSRTGDAKRCGRACQFIKPDYPAMEARVHGRPRDPGRLTKSSSAPSAAWSAPRSQPPNRARSGLGSPPASPSACWKPVRSKPSSPWHPIPPPTAGSRCPSSSRRRRACLRPAACAWATPRCSRPSGTRSRSRLQARRRHRHPLSGLCPPLHREGTWASTASTSSARLLGQHHDRELPHFPRSPRRRSEDDYLSRVSRRLLCRVALHRRQQEGDPLSQAPHFKAFPPTSSPSPAAPAASITQTSSPISPWATWARGRAMAPRPQRARRRTVQNLLDNEVRLSVTRQRGQTQERRCRLPRQQPNARQADCRCAPMPDWLRPIVGWLMPKIGPRGPRICPLAS